MAYAQKLVREGSKVEHSLFNSYEETVEYAKSKGIKKVIRVGEDITENEI